MMSSISTVYHSFAVLGVLATAVVRVKSLKGKFGATPTRSRHCEEENNASVLPTVSLAKWEGGDCSLDSKPGDLP
jgi:hypothetical protein